MTAGCPKCFRAWIEQIHGGAQHLALDQMLDRLRVRERALVETERLAVLGRLAAGVAHEINNPHVMNQMGHGVPNMVGADTRALDRRMSRVLPSYMSMGATGMGEMGEMQMPVPPNSVPMRGGDGPFSHIDMGGMFTLLKVRERPDRADPAGWYEHPARTVAGPATAERMHADGIDPTGSPRR